MSYVIGFHRSFTSLLASIIQDALCNSTQDLPSLLPPADDNPLGFFESKDLFNLNNEILQCVGHSWDHPWITPPRQSLIESEVESQTLFNFLQSHPATHIWTDKDPRLCLTVDTVNELSKFQRPSIGIVRHPFPAALSLFRRNNFKIEKSLLLWIIYNYFAFIGNKHLPSIIINSSSFVENPESCANAIHSFLGQIYGEFDVRPHIAAQYPSVSFVFDVIKKRTRPDLAHLTVESISQSKLAFRALEFWEALISSPSLPYQCTDRILKTGTAAYVEAIKGYSSLLDDDHNKIIVCLRKDVKRLTTDIECAHDRTKAVACEKQIYALQYADLLSNLKELQLEIASIYLARDAIQSELSKVKSRNGQLSRVIVRLVVITKRLQMSIARLHKFVNTEKTTSRKPSQTHKTDRSPT